MIVQPRKNLMQPSIYAQPTQDLTCDLDEVLRRLTKLHQAIWVFDIDHNRVLWANAEALNFWNADSLELLVDRDMGKDMSVSVAKRLQQYQADFKKDEACEFQEVWTLYPNGEPLTIDVVFSGIRLNDGRMAMFCEAIQETPLDAQGLRSAEALLHTSVMITLYAGNGEPLYRNPAARTSATSANQTLEQRFGKQATLKFTDGLDNDEVKIVELVGTINGPCWHDITARRCLDAVSGDPAWLISEVDVSRLKSTEEHAQFLAEHDTLTQLPNRNFVSTDFQKRINKLLADGNTGALLFLDLDRFKDVNDTLGHAAGDELLIQVSKRLIEVVGDSSSVARLGGDEFLLLLGQKSENEIKQLASQLSSIIGLPIELLGRKVTVTPSIGISLFPQNGRDIGDLMRSADLAMYHAKDSGRNSSAFFCQELSDAIETRISLEEELSIALAEDQFVTYFQPRVDTRSNVIVGAEALVRWEHPEKGLISPAIFIPACEASGIIGQVGKIVFAQAALARKIWLSQGYDLQVSVNLSPLQFGEESLVDDLLQILRDIDCTADGIELEITESFLLGNDNSTIAKLHALVEAGFRIAIDDFGTGYSNLAYLHRYPIGCLKIDRSFIKAIDSAQPIVELIVQMAHLFKLDVVAEGVETQQQLDTLRALECYEYQGFFFERPIDFPSFTELLTKSVKLSA